MNTATRPIDHFADVLAFAKEVAEAIRVNPGLAYERVSKRPVLDPFYSHPVDNNIQPTPANTHFLRTYDREPTAKQVADFLQTAGVFGNVDDNIFGYYFREEEGEDGAAEFINVLYITTYAMVGAKAVGHPYVLSPGGTFSSGHLEPLT